MSQKGKVLKGLSVTNKPLRTSILCEQESDNCECKQWQHPGWWQAHFLLHDTTTYKVERLDKAVFCTKTGIILSSFWVFVIAQALSLWFYRSERVVNKQKLTELSEISSQVATCMICALSGGEGFFKPANDEAADHEENVDYQERTHTDLMNSACVFSLVSTLLF